jgi:RNA polymerase sigma-70 factor (ECF subfamily)
MTRHEFDAVIEHHYQTLIKTAAAAGARDPEEAVHQTVVELIEKHAYRRFVEDAKRADIRTWLIRALRFRVKRQFEPPRRLSEEVVPIVRASTQADVECRLDVERALATLPTETAEIVRRIELEGATIREVAKERGMKAAAVYKRVARAREALRQRFAGG